ncbi:MAG TPA: VWA domain-containing protein [Ignavibacteriales bacterium]|nr:VWA domain-containing protein [Ignavibacteriales bacterium]HOL80807.1 VWA domain-containing protein [Ignavibacteriales bacterium]HOM66164.1 VWA domain-containing protein [Ignavibacteriales bacterium]HPP33243.1 VWA domain-containing protein [Ignavibacteriales bacterium]HRR17919.1 VWA domain-containing protein [Ignavibacteriales bacterium]
MKVGFLIPEFLLLVPVILILVFILYKFKKKIKIFVPSQELFNAEKQTFKLKIQKLPLIFGIISFILLVIGLSRPYKTISKDKKVIDICVVLDNSYTMISYLDYKPNRLEATKNIIKNLINEIQDARFGLVVFGSNSFELVPITFDKNILYYQIERLDENTFYPQFYEATAIGDGLHQAILSLSKNDDIKEKIIILATDGDNNAGEYDPVEVSQIANKKGIRIYTISIGKKGFVENKDPFSNRIVVTYTNVDENLLKLISNNSKGKFYSAENENELKEILKDIYMLERSKVKDVDESNIEELKAPFIFCSFIFFIISLLVRSLFIVKIQ